MKIHTKELKTAITQCKKVIAKRNSMPSLGWLRISRCDDDLARGVWVEATDLEVHCRVLVRGECPAREGEGPYAVELKAFGDAIKAADDEWTFITENEGRLEIAGKDLMVATVEAQDPENQPTMPDAAEFGFSRVDPVKLDTALKHVLVCASRDETRYNLNGLQVKAHRNGIRLAGTDGHRLAIHHIPDCEIEDLDDIIVPRNFWEALKPLLKRHRGKDLELAIHGGSLTARMEDTTITVKLIEGEYPSVEQVLPKGALPHQVQINRSEWEKILKDALPLLKKSGTRYHPILFELTGDEQVPTMSSGETFPRRPAPVMEVKGEGKAVKFGVNPKYLADAIKSFDGGLITIGIADATEKSDGFSLSPLLMTQSAKPGVDTYGITVVMPMRV